MFYAFWFYLAFMLLLGLVSYFRVRTYKDFVLAGAKQGTFSITLSLLAGIIGGSATFGMVSLVSKHGFPAFWWLGVGAIFLALQALFLAKPVRRLDAYSLAHITEIVIDKKSSLYISFIICVAWTGIIAAQFTALGQLLGLMLDVENPEYLIALVAVFVILYTLLGGQFSILQTDSFQFLLLFSTVLLIFFLFYFTDYSYVSGGNMGGDSWMMGWWDFKVLEWENIRDNLSARFELFNASFDGYELLYLSLLVGFSYFVGPDIFSRNLSAKSAKVAQRATLIAAFFLMVFAICMTYIGLWVNASILSQTDSHLLVVLINDYLPLPLAILFCIGLISALISSADTCLMSTATILGNDILRTKSIAHIRVYILIIGSISLSLALFQDDIIKLLIGAYSVYVPGFVVPLSTALFCYKKREVNKNLLFLAIFLGSVLGLCSNIFQMHNLALYGIGVSALLSLLSLVNLRSFFCRKLY